MRRFMLLGLLAAPSVASAMGLGTTGGIAGRGFGDVLWNGQTFAFGPSLPSLDLYPTYNLRIGINALDFLALLIDDTDQIYLGADVTVTALRVDSFNGLDGVIQPGGSLDIYSNFGTSLVLGGLCRFGVEGGGTMQGGLYLVPGIGVAALDGGNDSAVWSGRVELSLWFGNVGNKKGGGSPK